MGKTNNLWKNFFKIFYSWEIILKGQWLVPMKASKNKFSWMFSFINVVIVISCFILYTFSFFSRTYFILIVYFIPSVISRFLKIIVNVCNPQNCIKLKLVFMFLWESILWSLTNSKPSNCKKCYFLFTSSFFSCIAHSYKCD